MHRAYSSVAVRRLRLEELDTHMRQTFRSCALLATLVLTASACAKHYPIAGAPPPTPDADPVSGFTSDVPPRVERLYSYELALSVERAGFRTRLGRISGPAA